MALVLMRIFYVGLYWFPPERLGSQSSRVVASEEYRKLTGLLTVDGILNGRPEISLEALQHLVLPVVTLSIAYWGILGRVTRAAMIDEEGKEYIIAAKARGVGRRDLVWKHMGRNALTPALTSSMLSAAALFTSMFVVEIIFGFRGVSTLVVVSLDYTPDATVLLGFAVYSVIVVLLLMLILDLLIAVFDPRVREGVLTR
jgi:peptide/nickel transport system permease protein